MIYIPTVAVNVLQHDKCNETPKIHGHWSDRMIELDEGIDFPSVN